ncbi:hypothetical protein BO70DRAFT_301299 [Aspergillus heteromorphus CBS 117.55]|uniref:BZIP domain-containing protein n=1 Tax=Aspergillus heteromorphus CBS 117.55 TaxID=1448321 RepID=A0A317UYR9_9EURO|nr:uncharacterized protein BO70DRAFT_301299 [Aspergillus heteromorphus CBS 117.55]PWY67213.1 hypothetical protein BO70DRAFT_301299 [Aspergillus heteromorphus CBS 117.55]
MAGGPSQLTNPLVRTDYALAPAFTEEGFGYATAQIPVWNQSNEMQYFTSSGLERNLKYAHVRNGQPTPPPIDENKVPFSSDLYALSNYQFDGNQPANPTPRGSFSQQAGSSSEDSPPTNTKARKPRASRSGKGRPSANPTGCPEREKFLKRNRMAATKCRAKKKEYTESLTRKHTELSEENASLLKIEAECRREIIDLKNALLAHSSCGDKAINQHLSIMLTDIRHRDSLTAEQTTGTPYVARESSMSTMTNSTQCTQGLSFGFDSSFPPVTSSRPGSDQPLTEEGPYQFSSVPDDNFDDLINA